MLDFMSSICGSLEKALWKTDRLMSLKSPNLSITSKSFIYFSNFGNVSNCKYKVASSICDSFVGIGKLLGK